VQIVLENALALAFGSQPRILRADMGHTVILGSVILTYTQILQLVVGVFITVAFWIFLKHSRAGQICRAVSDDETLAMVLGIQTKRVHAMVFALGSILAGAGSILVFLDVGMDPYVGFPVVLVAAVACIIGGLRSFLTPAIGGLILGVTQSLVVWQTSAQWRDPVTFGLLILFILIRKQGLFGNYRRVEEA
jgi:branched-chain amino acid transport system permease protein